MLRFLEQLSICLMSLAHLDTFIWYSIALNYYKNQLFFSKTFVWHAEAQNEIKVL